MTTCSKLSTFFIGLIPSLLLQQELIGLTKKCINVTVSQKDIVHSNREISLQGEGELPLVQLSISFLISCFDNNGLYFLFFQQLSLKLIQIVGTRLVCKWHLKTGHRCL